MLKLNAYNIKYQVKKLGSYLILLNFIELTYIFLLTSSTYKNQIPSDIPFLFLFVWLFTYLWYIRLKKIFNAEELRQIRLEMSKKDKRYCQRLIVAKDQPIRISFSVIENKRFLEFKKKKTGKLIDISEGGVLIKINCANIIAGGKATGIKIKFSDGKSIVKVDGLIVRCSIDRCAIVFIKMSEHNGKIIRDHIFAGQMKLED